MSDWPAGLVDPGNIVISSGSQQSLGSEWLGLNSTASAVTTAWPAANRAIFIPFTLEVPATLRKMGWFNGATISGNADVGIYDASKTKVVSSGSTAQTGTSAFQVVTPSATVMLPSRYWLAMAMDNGTGFVQCDTFNAAAMQVLGVQQAATAFVLPTSPTFANPASAFQPVIAASFTPLAVL